MTARRQLGTEAADPCFADIERWPTEAAVEAMLDDQAAGLALARTQASAIAAAAEAAAGRLREGAGRLIYAGAGTSGRVAVQDGVELCPTFGWRKERLLFLVAGGLAALTESAEGAEDDRSAGMEAVGQHGIASSDVVICVAASGRTPFTCGVAEAASAAQACAIGIANNSATPLSGLVSHAIEVDSGPEVIAGSTRMKAGTVQKAVLNALSTAVMIRLGLVERGLMVSMRVSNDKLRQRSVRIVQQAAGVSEQAAAEALARTAHDIRKAIALARAPR